MSHRIVMDERLWRLAGQTIIHRAFELAKKGILTPPITIRVSEVGEREDELLLEVVVADLEGDVQVGDACPVRVERTVFLPLRFTFEDGTILHRCVFEVPPAPSVQ